MKSRITIDLVEAQGASGSYEPVISMFVSYETGDVRDKMMNSFIQGLGYESNMLSIHREEMVDNSQGALYIIRPVPVVPPVKESEFFSQFSIDEEVEYYTEDVGWLWGKVTAVKFTAAKVWYDILEDTTGSVVSGVVSNRVRPFKQVLPELSE